MNGWIDLAPHMPAGQGQKAESCSHLYDELLSAGSWDMALSVLGKADCAAVRMLRLVRHVRMPPRRP
jgi:hypothetical protein